MKRLIILIAASLIASAAVADPIEDGKAAFEQGNYQTALKLLQSPAEHGDAVAQYDMGIMYERGWGGAQQDYAQAMQWLLKSAAQGCAQAQTHVSYLYSQGMGVPRDANKASYWTLKRNLGKTNDMLKCKDVGLPPANYTPPDGVIPNAETAVKVGKAILAPIFGEGLIKSEEPFSASLSDDTWTVTGHLPDTANVGGVAEIDLSKSKGCVLRINHGQ